MTRSIETPGTAPDGGQGERGGEHGFPFIARLLHWSTAVLVLALFAVGIAMTSLGTGRWAAALHTLHKTVGVFLFVLVALRLGYRVVARLRGRWARAAGGRVIHRVLYGLLLVVPLLGLAGVSDFGGRTIYGGIELPAIWPEGAGHADALFRSHAVLAFLLVGLVTVHICLALDEYIRQPQRAEPAQAALGGAGNSSSLPGRDVS